MISKLAVSNFICSLKTFLFEQCTSDFMLMGALNLLFTYLVRILVDPSHQFIKGIVMTLTHYYNYYCVCCILIACSGGKHARDIFKYLSMALDKSIQHSRYDMPRSALQLLAKHACQWDQCIIDEYQVIADFDSSLLC